MRIFASIAAVLLMSASAVAQQAPISAPTGDWQVERLDGKPLTPGSSIRLRFADARLSGKACNIIGAAYRVQGANIAFGPPMATRMACPRPIMMQEQRLLALLRSPGKWAVSGGRLTLRNAAGGSLSALRKR